MDSEKWRKLSSFSYLLYSLIEEVNFMKLLDVVALLEDIPELCLYRGQVGTIVEEYEPGVVEVEFSDTNGRAYAIDTLRENQLILLHHEPLTGKTLIPA